MPMNVSVAVCSLRCTFGFALTVVLTLALGIGALHGRIHGRRALLLRDLAVRDGSRRALGAVRRRSADNYRSTTRRSRLHP
jgi:hypothetical protein